MNLIGRPDLGKKYASHDDRVEAKAQEEIYPAIEEFLKDKTKEEANRIFTSEGIISQPLLTVLEAANCDHWLDRGALGWYDDPYYGDVFTQKVMYKMSESPPRLETRAPSGGLRQRRNLPAGLRPQLGPDPGNGSQRGHLTGARWGRLSCRPAFATPLFITGGMTRYD